MNIYFSCAITGGRQDQAVYLKLVEFLLAAGHEIPTAHIAEPAVMALELQVTPEEVYRRDIGWLDECDAVIAEVSTPSHGVGYEIAYALGLGKPVLCCYSEDRKVSKMITGNSHPTLSLASYRTVEEVVAAVNAWLSHFPDAMKKVTHK